MSALDYEPTPFGAACAVRSLGDGTFTADLRHEWSIGGHPHGGFLVALLARAATAALTERGEPTVEPLVVSTEFLRAPAAGPALLRTDIRKVGRTVTSVGVVLEQRGRSCVEARAAVGSLPVRRPLWNDAPAMPAEPPASAVALTSDFADGAYHMAGVCDVRVDAATSGVLTGRTGDPPRLRLWVRPRDGEPDPYFALVAGDVNPPVVRSLGRFGWAPTVQLTAYVRARPAPGWLRVHVDCRSVQESWFDSDATVVDAQGRIVCQARQLALAP